MSPQIDPLILAKLHAFSQRRRQLIVRRGIYAAVATLLAAMMLVALVDWLFVLPDAVRWALSGAAYLAIVVVEWRACWRLLLRSPEPRELARLVEQAEPKLREDLLSAVELGEAREDAVFDSAQFRALVQSGVAARVKTLDVERLLPSRILRRYAFIAAGIGLAGVIALALTGLQFGTLLMRALLPMANIARVSAVRVEIVEPSPAERSVPQGDTLPLVVELSGRRATKAFLETFTPAGGREVVPLSPLADNRFSATIQVGRENVAYRVRAGDALTRKYQLAAVARPAVVEFRKSYTYPAYAQLSGKVVTEENGDLAGLEGSAVELRLRTNQKIGAAELRIEQGKASSVVPLRAEGEFYVATIPLSASGNYRVHLVGAESGFENKFSPEYELRAEPDLVPQVTLELPKQDLILPSNEIVDVRGTAADDLALASVAQLVKINEGEWRATPLSTARGVETKVERRWDLFEQGVKPGDLVTMKLVATDLKGNTAESRPLQVTITAAGFEAQRIQALIGQRQLLEMLQAQAAAASVLAKQTGEARKEFERWPDGDPQRAQALAPASAAAEEFAQKHAAAASQLATVLRAGAPGHAVANLVLLGQLIFRGGLDEAPHAHSLLAAVKTSPASSSARELVRAAVDAANRSERRSRQTVDIFRILLTAEEIDVFNENLQVVAQEEERLTSLAHRSGTDAQKWVPVADRLRVVLSEMRSLDELAGAAVGHGPRWIPDRMRNLQKSLNKQRETMERALAAPPGGELLSPTLEMARNIGEIARQAFEVRRDFRGPTGEGVRDLFREVEPSYLLFEQVRQETARYFRNDRIPGDQGAILIRGRWAAKQAGLKARGDLEETRPDADTFFVSDVRLASRVAQAFSERVVDEEPKSYAREWQGIERTFRVLEVGHEMVELHAAAQHLAVAERWEFYNPKARTANPQDWAWLGERLRILPDEIGKALNFEERRALAQAAQKLVREAPGQPFTQALHREMEERFNPARPPASARDSADALVEYLAGAVALFREPMEEARKELARLAPTLADTMKELAKKTEKLREQTLNQAQQAQEKLPEEAKADARTAQLEQQRLNEEIEALKDALRADANQQNILQNDGRERARDADDALALLKDPPIRAEGDLALAARSESAAQQEQALNQAAGEQQKLAKALEQLSAHYEAMEQGKVDETRLALRATETANGIKEQLDQQFAKAEELARLAQASPEELLAELEKALPQNPEMQQELSAIAQNTVQGASEQLKQASAQESAVAKSVQKLAADEQSLAALTPTNPPPAALTTPNLPNAATAPTAPAAASPTPPSAPPAPPNPALAQAAQQQTPIAQAAGKAADDLSRAGRHEARMQNSMTGEQLQKLGSALQKTAEQQVTGAQQALEKAQAAAQAQPAVNAASEELQRALSQLLAVSNPPAPASGAAPTESAKAQPSGANSPAEKPNVLPSTSAKSAMNAPGTPAGQPTGSTPPASNLNPGAPPNREPSGGTPSQPTATNPPTGATPPAVSPSSPGEQVWMARALDALDAALNATASSQPSGAPPQAPPASAAQKPSASGNASQAQQSSAAQQAANGKPAPQSNSMSQAQSALASAAQAAAAAARADRAAESGAPGQSGQPQPGSLQALSKGGAPAANGTGARNALAEAKNRAGDWGKLPKQMAEDLTQGQREGIAGEYRNQVETYYHAIAEKSKKP